MTIFQSIILGIVQGITEFLPISSSAHLVLVPHLLGWQIPQEQAFPFDVLVQLGTLLAVIFYFWNDLKEILIYMAKGIKNIKPFEDPASRTGWFVILATIPAGVIGLMFKSRIEMAFQQPAITAALLIGTALMLFAAEITGKCQRDIDTMTWLDAIWIGIFQVFSLFPGISRSGSVITGGMTRGFKRKPASQFAFLMAIPIMLAASLLGILDLIKVSNLGSFAPVMLVGFLTAAIVGYFSIRWLIKFISTHSLLPFAGYCLILGVGSLLSLWISPITSFTFNAFQEYKNITIDIDPELTWILPTMNECSNEKSDIEWITSVKTSDYPAVNNQQITFHLNEPEGNEYSNFLIGTVSIYPVTSVENPIESLTFPITKKIFTGQISSWQELYDICPECYQNSEISSYFASAPIAIWLKPPESTFNQKILDTLDLGNNPPAFAFFAPNDQALIQAITDIPHAIGFLPTPAINEKLKKILFLNSQQEMSEIDLPIFASLYNEPDKQIKDWLYCIQEEIKRY